MVVVVDEVVELIVRFDFRLIWLIVVGKVWLGNVLIVKFVFCLILILLMFVLLIVILSFILVRFLVIMNSVGVLNDDVMVWLGLICCVSMMLVIGDWMIVCVCCVWFCVRVVWLVMILVCVIFSVVLVCWVLV